MIITPPQRTGYPRPEPFIIFQGMQVFVILDDNDIYLKNIENRERVKHIPCNNTTEARRMFELINKALCFNEADHPQMFL